MMSIDKINPGDEICQSLDLVHENIQKLKSLFPEIVAEGKIDFEVLRQLLGEKIEDSDEYYRLTWAGKSQARREAHKPSTGTLRPVREESLDWDTTKNIYIEGDNLEVLKLLQKNYGGRVRMIYIDPPYNTGRDFVYRDDYTDNLRNYQELTGQIDSAGNRLSTNSDSDGRYHSNWLNMMYPRLILARNLLQEDGVIFTSIDGTEFDNLKKIFTEIFGEENLFADMIVIRAEGGGLAKKVVKGHDYLLIFVKSQLKFKGIFRPKDIRGKIVEKNGRRFWIEEDWLRKEFGKYGTLPYEDIEKIKGAEKKKEIDRGIESGKYVIIEKGENRIVGRYRALDEDGSKFYSIIKHLNKTGVDNLRKLDMHEYFDFPKPVSLIKELIQGATFFTGNQNEIILDFFAGSSTTAHAVLEKNMEDGGTRRFIQVQLPEPTKDGDDAYRDGFRNIAEIGKERIRRVVKAIKQEDPVTAEAMDLGFKVFKLDSSNIKSWDGSPENLEESLYSTVENIKGNRSQEDVLYEILLKLGLDLTLPVEKRIVGSHTVFNVGSGSLFVCLGDEIDSSVAEEIGRWKEDCSPDVCRVVFKDSGFTDVEKVNSFQILKRFGIKEMRSI